MKAKENAALVLTIYWRQSAKLMDRANQKKKNWVLINRLTIHPSWPSALYSAFFFALQEKALASRYLHMYTV